MIIRAILFFLAFVALFFALYWTALRTKYFNAGRVKEIAKVFFLTVIAFMSAGMVIAFIIAADKLS